MACRDQDRFSFGEKLSGVSPCPFIDVRPHIRGFHWIWFGLVVYAKAISAIRSAFFGADVRHLPFRIGFITSVKGFNAPILGKREFACVPGSSSMPVKTIFFYGTRLRQQCEENHELGYELMKRIAEVVIRDLHGTEQRLMDCDLKKWTG